MHPDIDGYIKTLTRVDPNGTVNRGESSRNQFTDRYMLCWTIMNSTTCISRDGEVLQGPNEIMGNGDDLPQGVSLFQQETAYGREGGEGRRHMLGSTGRGNFSADKYKVLDFGNI